jgi:hypothetical protein
MPVERFGNLVSKGFDLTLVALGVQIHPAVSQVLDVTRDIITTGQTEDLGTKTDPLDMAYVPDITMGDMG